MQKYIEFDANRFSTLGFSPPQLVNTSERKTRKAGSLERENGSAFPARFNFSLFPASATVGGLCGGERYQIISVNNKEHFFFLFY